LELRVLVQAAAMKAMLQRLRRLGLRAIAAFPKARKGLSAAEVLRRHRRRRLEAKGCLLMNQSLTWATAGPL
jgi:hypothetical protein